jgi:hypothetical protein
LSEPLEMLQLHTGYFFFHLRDGIPSLETAFSGKRVTFPSAVFGNPLSALAGVRYVRVKLLPMSS